MTNSNPNPEKPKSAEPKAPEEKKDAAVPGWHPGTRRVNHTANRFTI